MHLYWADDPVLVPRHVPLLDHHEQEYLEDLQNLAEPAEPEPTAQAGEPTERTAVGWWHLFRPPLPTSPRHSPPAEACRPLPGVPPKLAEILQSRYVFLCL